MYIYIVFDEKEQVLFKKTPIRGFNLQMKLCNLITHLNLSVKCQSATIKNILEFVKVNKPKPVYKWVNGYADWEFYKSDCC